MLRWRTVMLNGCPFRLVRQTTRAQLQTNYVDTKVHTSLSARYLSQRRQRNVLGSHDADGRCRQKREDHRLWTIVERKIHHQYHREVSFRLVMLNGYQDFHNCSLFALHILYLPIHSQLTVSISLIAYPLALLARESATPLNFAGWAPGLLISFIKYSPPSHPPLYLPTRS